MSRFGWRARRPTPPPQVPARNGGRVFVAGPGQAAVREVTADVVLPALTATAVPEAIGGVPEADAGAPSTPASAGPIVVSSPDAAVSAVVAALSGYLRPVAGMPDPTVVVLQVGDRTLGLGNSRGLEAIGAFDAAELFGGRIDCVVRFQVWGTDVAAADTAMTELQGRLLGARASLFHAGFLTLDGVAGALPACERDAWSRTADYHALVEYHLAAAPSAGSLIAAIPVDAEQEVAGSLVSELATVTGDTVRWDPGSAPALVVRGRRSVEQLGVTAFLPVPQPSGAVRIQCTHDGATGMPTDYPTLPALLAAVADPVAPERNGRYSFPSLAAFVATFDVAGSLLLADPDHPDHTDDYVVGQLPLEPPIRLTAATDRLEISLQTSPLDNPGVVYLRPARALN